MRYMQGLFDDWQARNITSVLHEKTRRLCQQHGFDRTALPPRRRRRACGSSTGVEVTGFEFGSNSRRGHARSSPTQGRIACDYVVVGVGPWINRIWNMLELPKRITVKGRDGKLHDGVRMWKYWCLRGRHARGRSRAAQDQRRRHAAGHPCRYRCAALLRHRRHADHRPAVGPLLQARLQFRRRSGRRVALCGRAGRRRGRGRSLWSRSP